jgi:hypothetical protein
MAAAEAKQPATPPVRVEIRVGGKVRFSNDCYDPALRMEDNVVHFDAALHPTMVDVAPKLAPQRFGDDPRDGDVVIQQVHSGSRKTRQTRVAAPSPRSK